MKSLRWINLVGVLLLAALCAGQWRRDRRQNLELLQGEKQRLAGETQLREQTRKSDGLAADLARFKEQYLDAHTNTAAARASLLRVEQELGRLRAERDQLQSAVTNWAAAVTARDASLRALNERWRETAGQLDDSVLRHNELASNYNATVRRFNELATNYNSVVTQLNTLRAAPPK